MKLLLELHYFNYKKYLVHVIYVLELYLWKINYVRDFAQKNLKIARGWRDRISL